ncbi:uncharacterized protein DNG_00273 [Cephalotrichum gorgonifer]|uniref:Major facilitator superfamily transporter n=1 Tax=Cephalotrichum gorgonifer TaxID=2041049 RepID=A0AAE8SQL6_9PEZI|nr:uncharacterized protein DNG_00273 [Cephalotrichum gorgonifer]
MPGLSGVLSLPFRRQGRHNAASSLPTYERLSSPTKERFSEDYDSDYSDVDDLDSFPPSHSSTPTSGGSRQSSLSASSSAMMLPRKRPTVRQRVRRIYPYRLPSRSARCLAVVIVVSLVTMAVTLVRASQADNMRIAQGGYKRPAPPASPPTWERFPLLSRYYGGLRTLVPLDQNEPEYPLPEDIAPPPVAGDQQRQQQQQHRRELPSSKAFASEHPGSIFVKSPEEMNACFLDAENMVTVPAIRYYDGRPSGFPDHVLGSYEDLSLPGDICFDRFGRYGPYGLGYSIRQGGVGRGDLGDTEGASDVWAETAQVDYRRVDWADAQRRCYNANVDRFRPLPTRPAGPRGFYIGESPTSAGDKKREGASEGALAERKPSDTSLQTMARTAVVLRCWDEMEWQVDEIMFVRSLITELSLASGGRYDVHILVQVKDEAKNPIWADSDAYERVIRERIPREFRGLVTLWTQTQMLALYQGIYDLYPKGPDLPVHGSYRGLQMAMQHFAREHAEYEQFWQWEMDIRYTGHYYDFFTKVEGWAREQPRRGLWERGERFYVPSVHGPWEDFKQTTRFQTEGSAATTSADAGGRKGFPGLDALGRVAPKKPIWGPERPADEADWFEPRKDPRPEVETPEQDTAYAWGVGEEADLITFNPMFDPEGTTWGLADDITGYNTTEGRPPRRAAISTASRMSRRLLTTMHRQTALKKQFAFSEMWPATVALQHGYKAVYAPHPEFVDRRWPPAYLAGVLNGGRAGTSGGSRTSVFGQGEHNMHGLSWFYRSDFAAELYRAWLGLASRYTSGEEFELGADESRDGPGVEGMRGGEGRMCLPPMLLHPIKNLGMVVEAPPEEQMAEPEEEPEFDPGS